MTRHPVHQGSNDSWWTPSDSAAYRPLLQSNQTTAPRRKCLPDGVLFCVRHRLRVFDLPPRLRPLRLRHTSASHVSLVERLRRFRVSMFGLWNSVDHCPVSIRSGMMFFFQVRRSAGRDVCSGEGIEPCAVRPTRALRPRPDLGEWNTVRREHRRAGVLP